MIRQEMEESEVVIEGEYVSRDVMLNEWQWTELLDKSLLLTVFMDATYASNTMINRSINDRFCSELRKRVSAVIRFCRTCPAKYMRP